MFAVREWGEIETSLLIPAAAEVCRQRRKDPGIKPGPWHQICRVAHSDIQIDRDRPSPSGDALSVRAISCNREVKREAVGTHTNWKAYMFTRGATAPESVHKQTTVAHTPSTRNRAVFITCSHEATALVRGFIQLQSSGGDLWSCWLQLYMSVSGEEGKTQKWEVASRARLRAPQGTALYSITPTASGKAMPSRAAPVVHRAILAG